MENIAAELNLMNKEQKKDFVKRIGENFGLMQSNIL